jgi:hypothetical protein
MKIAGLSTGEGWGEVCPANARAAAGPASALPRARKRAPHAREREIGALSYLEQRSSGTCRIGGNDRPLTVSMRLAGQAVNWWAPPGHGRPGNLGQRRRRKTGRLWFLKR